MKKHNIYFLIALLQISFLEVNAQKNIPAYVYTVFDNLITSYGSIKVAPVLEFSKPNESVIAFYKSAPQPTVLIDRKLLTICSSFKADSLNALSIVLSHELAHYYNDHTFCYDFSFANSKNPVSRDLIIISKESKKEKEIQADYQGLWYALMAGYKPIQVFDKTFDKIYKDYNLPDKIKDYPSKAERKLMKTSVFTKMQELAPVFQAGLILSENQYFNESASCFEYLLLTIPTKENFNNAGLACFSLALGLKPKESIPFVYPLSNDYNSFLNENRNSNATKGGLNNAQTYEPLLKKAKLYFEKAISINPEYLEAHLNLASLQSSIGNQEAAIGILNALPKNLQQNQEVLLIKAIANYMLENETAAKKLFDQLQKTQNSIITFDSQLFKLASGPKSVLNKFLIDYQTKNLATTYPFTKLTEQIKVFNCLKFNNLEVCTNPLQDQIIIKNSNSQTLFCKFVNAKWELSH